MAEQISTAFRPKGAASYLNISKATLQRWLREGKFGDIKPIQLSPRVTVWRKADLDAWLEQQASREVN